MAELIVYLEPAKDTTLYQCLSTFLNKSKDIYYPSTATKYPPHASVTGFFNINDREWISIIIDKYDQCIKKITAEALDDESNIPKIDIEPLLVSRPYSSSTLSSYQKQHLLLPIKVSTSFYALLSQCVTDINNNILIESKQEEKELTEKNELIRQKRVDHISLLYFDEPNAIGEGMKNWLNWSNTSKNIKVMQDDIFNQLKKLESNNNNKKWDIVLYERVHKSIIIGESHQFKELARWHIY